MNKNDIAQYDTGTDAKYFSNPYILINMYTVCYINTQNLQTEMQKIPYSE